MRPASHNARSLPIVQAFFFDLDGTLMDTERLWVAAAETVLAQLGRPVTHAEALALVYGRGWVDIYRDMEQRWPGLFRDMDHASGLLGAEMEARKRQADVRIHSSIALLRRLAASYPVAIVSGSTRGYIQECMALGGFTDHVAFIVGCEDYPRGKPDPAPYALAAERAAVPAPACVVFEDSRAGIASAKAAGMHAVALQRPAAPAQDFSAADEVYADLADFPAERYL